MSQIISDPAAQKSRQRWSEIETIVPVAIHALSHCLRLAKLAILMTAGARLILSFQNLIDENINKEELIAPQFEYKYNGTISTQALSLNWM